MQSASNQLENMQTHQDQISESGFTLIEVMVVVAIIGI
jgi:prepilin-type N-terminal cleavage/methylation domain-containing protein